MKRIFVAMICVFMAFGAFAATDKALVANAEKYLNSITGITGDFVQTNKGKKEKGTFSCCAQDALD